jgi:hypothetical protein
MLDMRKGVCALCGHGEIIDAPAREFTDDDGEPVQLAVAHAPEKIDFMGTKRSADRPFGRLRMLVCRSCGFVQWFASKPEKIPVNDTLGTKLIRS